MSALAAQAAQALAQGDTAAAEAAALAALAADPIQAEALQVLGLVRRRQNRLAEALALLREAWRQAPHLPHAASNLVSALTAAGLADEAVATATQAIAAHPGFAALPLNLGVALHGQKRLDEAAQAFATAARLQPDLFVAHFYQGCVLEEAGQPQAAETPLRQAVALAPGNAAAHNHLGRVLHAQDRHAEARECFAAAAALAPDDSAILNNLGSALLRLDRPAEALAPLTRAQDQAPDDAGIQANLALLHTELQDLDQAMAHSRRAIALEPDKAEHHWTHALQLLQCGQWRQGWEEYEWRWRLPEHPPFTGLPWWIRGPVDAATVVVAAEQGHGDTLQFLRYVPMLAARCRRVVLRVQPALAALVAESFPQCVVVGNDDPLPAADLLVPLMSLPHRLGVGAEAPLPAYLRPPADRLAPWAERLAALPGRIKVGLAWRGSPTHKRDRLRSVPLETLAGLADRLDDVTFVALHPDATAADSAVFPPGRLDVSLAAELCDFADTAALMTHLPLVVSVDSSPAHLAGALGRPCQVLVPAVPDWRWGLAGEPCRWYASVTPVRQGLGESWAEVVGRVGLTP